MRRKGIRFINMTMASSFAEGRGEGTQVDVRDQVCRACYEITSGGCGMHDPRILQATPFSPAVLGTENDAGGSPRPMTTPPTAREVYARWHTDTCSVWRLRDIISQVFDASRPCDCGLEAALDAALAALVRANTGVHPRTRLLVFNKGDRSVWSRTCRRSG